jgi:glycosyltransferase involved in cell wall biosynthesis
MSSADIPPPLIVISQLPPPVHGSTVMTQVLLQALGELGEEAVLVDRRFSTSIEDVGAFTLRKVAAAVGLVARLARASGGRRPRIAIFFITTRLASFLVDCALAEVLRLRRVKTIAYVHARGYRELAARGRWMARRVARLLGNAHTVVCLSESLVADVAPWVSSDRVVCIPNTPLEVPANAGRGGGDAPPSDIVLFLSNLLPDKGAADFIAMAALASRELPSARFDIAGAPTDDAYAAELKNAAADVAASVHFLGPLGGEAKWRALRDASVLVFPSWDDAQPLTIAEAFAMGTPVVAYETGGIVDMIVDGRQGYLVPQGDVAGLARRVQELVGEPRRRAALSDAAMATFHDQYSHDVYRRRWRELLVRVRDEAEAGE